MIADWVASISGRPADVLNADERMCEQGRQTKVHPDD
jgi:hypothetical protein